MRVASTGAIIEREGPPANRKGTKSILQRIIQPDQTLLIAADTRGMRTTTATSRGIVIFSHTIIRSRLSSSEIQYSNSTDPALGPPDITIRISRNQVRSQTGTTC